MVVNACFASDRATAEPGKQAVRVRALDDELAAVALQATDDGLIAMADDASPVLELLA